jgi:tRNA dimethylallyltransferase
VLHQRIAQRYQMMMSEGFLEEVIALHQRGEHYAVLPAMRAVGYRQVWQHLSGDFDLETAIEKAIIATRQMAKRQLTWLRAQQDGSWFDSSDGLPLTDILSFLASELPELKIKLDG